MIILSDFFPTVLTDKLPLMSDPVSSDVQDSTQYSTWTQQYCSLDCLDYSSYIQFFYFLSFGSVRRFLFFLRNTFFRFNLRPDFCKTFNDFNLILAIFITVNSFRFFLETVFPNKHSSVFVVLIVWTSLKSLQFYYFIIVAVFWLKSLHSLLGA